MHKIKFRLLCLLGSLLLVMLVITACTSGADEPITSTPETAEDDGGDTAPETAEDVTITWLRLAEWNAADPKIIETFEAEHPGIKVEVEEIPFSELVSQINLRFEAEDESIDVISADVPLVSSYGYKGWLLPIDDVFAEDELAC